MDTKKRLLIVDDSRFMRQAIADFFSQDATIDVIGEAKNGVEAIEAVANLEPDVVTLDVNMPVMDGLTALKHLMIRSPLPTIMLSTLMKEGAQATFDALRYGALDFILKPSQLKGNLDQQRQEICRKVRLASHVEVSAMRYIRAVPQDKPLTNDPCRRVVILGAAEGGYSVLLKIIPHLILETPRTAYVIILYADPMYTDAFAKYLDQYSAVRVTRVKDGELLKSGVCYLGSGSEYVTFLPNRDDLTLHITEAPFPWRRGSINRLLFSASEILGSQGMAVLLSGAGEDGAEGASELMNSGGIILVQEPKTCLDKEMALNTIDLCEFGCQTVPDGSLGNTINDLLN